MTGQVHINREEVRYCSMKYVLGISAFYHDSAAAIVVGGRVAAAVQEERFTREKHTSVFPVNSIRYCLETAGIVLDELDAVVFYEKPLLKFERLLETYYQYVPLGVTSFRKSIPVWLKEKLFHKKLIRDSLAGVGEYDRNKLRLLFSEHHLSHAASAYLVSPYESAAIITIDGVGEWSTATIGFGENAVITTLREMNFPHSVGLLYSAFTYYLGFRVNSGEYKVMGLAPYGDAESEQTKQYVSYIKSELITINDDGSVWLNQRYFSYATGLRMTHDKHWEKIFGFGRREPEAKIEQHHCNLAMAVQEVIEEVVVKMAYEAKRLTGSDNLCMAGGVALNCVANRKILETGLFKNVYIQPAAGDAGGALGAALAVSSMFFNEGKSELGFRDGMYGSYLGPEFTNSAVTEMYNEIGAVGKLYKDYDTLAEDVATKLAKGAVVGWFQGRMEFGPRALGNRSILADAANPHMQHQLNLKIKYRESFRPFAPAVLEEDMSEWFDMLQPSPYMLFTAPVKAEKQFPLPDNYSALSMQGKMSVQRSKLPSVTHVDCSARVQTVSKETNPRFHTLLLAFKHITGYSVLANTSFNVRGAPIVCTPHDAYTCFMATEMDYLVINDYLFAKTEQPDWENKEKWNRNYQPD